MTDSNRLVVISNRIPGDEPPAGGLVFALDDCVRRQGGLWIGNSGETPDTPAIALRKHDGYPYPRMTFDTTEAEHEQFYLGYSNSVLWPLCHRRTDLMDIQRSFYEGYSSVNERLARQMLDVIRPSDTIWVHDYHFLPLAHELRRLGCGNRMGFFLHIPFPAVNDLQALTERQEMMSWLAAYDLVGLQAQRDVAECVSALRLYAEAELLEEGNVLVGGRQTIVRSFPIGIDAKAFAELAQCDAAPPYLRLSPTEKLLIGVDRLDYSKGLVERFAAFGEFLKDHSDNPARTTLLQIAPASRSEVAAYQSIREELERMAGAVNGQHAELDWTPIRYLRRSYDRAVLAQLYRQAEVALVSPLIDGMNLVAKEFVAAQDPQDPGVLILSNLAGSAEQLTSAILVNPFDTTEMAEAIQQALDMPLDERLERYQLLAEDVFERDLFWWVESYLGVLMQTSATSDHDVDDIAYRNPS